MQLDVTVAIRDVRKDRRGGVTKGMSILLSHERHGNVVEREEEINGGPRASLENQGRVGPRVVRRTLDEDAAEGVLLASLLEPLLDGVDVLPLHGGHTAILTQILA